MISSSTVSIDAPADLVWNVFTDVEHWPEWTASVTRLTGLDGPGLAVGRRFEIDQPRLPKLQWVVTDVVPHSSWTWVQRSRRGHDRPPRCHRDPRGHHGGTPGTRPARDRRRRRRGVDAPPDEALSGDGGPRTQGALRGTPEASWPGHLTAGGATGYSTRWSSSVRHAASAVAHCANWPKQSARVTECCCTTSAPATNCCSR